MNSSLKKALRDSALRQSTILLSIIACGLAYRTLPALSLNSTVAQADPDYTQEVLNNTVCSFIVTEDVDGIVNVRQGPSANSPVVATLRRGDGVRATNRQGNWVNLAARTQGTGSNARFTPLQGWVHNRFINGCSESEFDRWRR